jgi:hypothetical protein
MRWTRGGVRRFSADEAPLADGEIVWFWRRDRGVDPVRCAGWATVTTNAAHRGEHV